MKQSISVGDAVTLPGKRRGKVLCVSNSGALFLVHVHGDAPAGEATRVLCAAHEVRRINAWWNERQKREAYASGKRTASHACARRPRSQGTSPRQVRRAA